MPELPEVQVVCNFLRKEIIGLSFIDVEINNYNLRKKIDSNLCSFLINKNIVDIYRKAKYIVMELCNKQNLVIHLGMTGKFFNTINGAKHNHVVFKFNNNKTIVYNDPRRFGSIQIVKDTNCFFSNTGPDPLSDSFDHFLLKKYFEKKNISIKNAMMDSSIIAGIGNIYACEILFLSKISPFKKTKEVTLEDCIQISKNTKNILIQSIKKGGSSIKDYKDPQGTKGSFQNCFVVYNRQGLKCFVCQEEIKKYKQNGRSTFWCESCQK